MSEEFTIEDLEKHSGLSTRTLHYYMHMGLLPGPEKRGVNATYSQEHLDRLDLILILKEMHLPLKEIRKIFDRLTPAEIVHYRDDQEDLLEKIKGVRPQASADEKAKNGSSALDYIKGLEEAHQTYWNITDNQLQNIKNDPDKLLSNFSIRSIKEEKNVPPQEIWRRITLADGVELNFRDTRDRERRYKIDRLLSFARSLFDEQK
jgi:DNA-binding transcriptional MerR regulator